MLIFTIYTIKKKFLNWRVQEVIYKLGGKFSCQMTCIVPINIRGLVKRFHFLNPIHMHSKLTEHLTSSGLPMMWACRTGLSWWLRTAGAGPGAEIATLHFKLAVEWQTNAHCVLLGPKYPLKKTCLSCDAPHFDGSYASPGHNGKNSWIGKSQKENFFLQRHLWPVPTWDQ